MGSDDVPNEFLTHLPNSARDILLTLYNHSWSTGTYPTLWKQATLIPIQKAGKDPKLSSSYRPISLLSCLGKTMERLINTRLTWWLEHNNLLPSYQLGFRPQRSTEDLLLVVEHNIRRAYQTRTVLLTVFIDLQGAFDRASHAGILQKLATLGLGGTPLKWFEDFLAHRTFSVAVGNNFSSPQPLQRGIPQGSVLSPTLFNILMSDLPTTPQSTLLVYADDITILYSADTVQRAQEGMQETVNQLHQWTTQWGLKINAQKSHHMCFTRKKIPTIPTITIEGAAIPYVTTHNLLGLVFDGPILTFKHQIEYLRTACLKRLDVMKRISGIRWGADRETLLMLYKSFILSKIQYGAAIYGSASPTNLKKLDTVQNTALRIALGAFMSTPITCLQVETGLLPLQYTRHIKMCNTVYKASTAPTSHPITTMITDALTSPGVGPVNSLPVIERAVTLLEDASLPLPYIPEQNSAVPPQYNVASQISLHLGHKFKKGVDPPQLAQQLFSSRHSERYSLHTPIYTDGSHSPEKNQTTSAVYFPTLQRCKTWRLPSSHSNLAAELHAILGALDNIDLIEKDRVVIYSDSQTGLALISDRLTRTYTTLVRKIQLRLYHLTTGGCQITLQWVPSHTGITGNEIADRATREAVPDLEEPLHLEYQDAQNCTKKKFRRRWDTELKELLEETTLGQIRRNTSPAPWSRNKYRHLDVALFRLRTGHCGLNKHRHRLHLSDSPYCRWCQDQEETVEHFLLHCHRFYSLRTTLRACLSRLGIQQLTLAVLLDGAGFDPPVRQEILNETTKFITDSGQLSRI